jgi:hypothetical protein
LFPEFRLSSKQPQHVGYSGAVREIPPVINQPLGNFPMKLKLLTTALILAAVAAAGPAVADKVSSVSAAASGKPPVVTSSKHQIQLTRVTPEYWRVTFHNPPYNIFGPGTIPQLSEVVIAMETDPMVKVVVFDSDVPDFFLTHYDFAPPLTDTLNLPNGPTACRRSPT